MRNAASMLLKNKNFTFNSEESKIKIPDNLQIRRNLYLIFKEILNNIAKHSLADSIEINITNKANEFIINVSDNGVGFESDKIKYGYGIRNIRNRMNEMGGSFEIESKPGRGTRIEISLKYEGKA